MSSTDREADELVRHYAAGSRAKMRHDALIRDACRGAQGIIDFQPGGPATWTTTTSEIGAHYRPARKAPAADPRDAAPFTTMRVPVPRTTCGSPGQVTVRVPASVRRILQELRGAVEEAAAQRNLRAQSGASGRGRTERVAREGRRHPPPPDPGRGGAPREAHPRPHARGGGPALRSLL